MTAVLKASTEALQLSEQRFKDFAEMAADWFWEQDASLRFTYTSGYFEETTGISLAQVIGTPDERALTARVVAAMREKAADLGGAFGLGALKAVLEHARVLVCNDAGARHVAVAFDVPCVVLMGPTALEKTNLNLERVKVLTADVDCRPCYQRECPIDHRCMTRIGAERVADEALPALARDAAQRWQGAQLVAGGGAR